MYLHIGRDVVVSYNEIVAIIDYKTIKKSEANKEFIQIAELEGILERKLKQEEIKACVITKDKVYLSSISAGTLWRRSRN